MLSYARVYHRGKVTLPLTSTLENQAWHITGTESAEYIEALSFSTDGANDGDDVASSCQYGTLVDDEIHDWVTQSGGYVPLKSQDTRDTLRGGIRLLVLERSFYQPPSFHIKKETYLTIEKQFHLPENTLLALSDECGLATHVLDIDKRTRTLKRLGMIIKAAQKFQVGNYGLAFSHDFVTGLSTGILHGTGVTQHGGGDFELWRKHAAAEIFEHIKAAHASWTHPLFLPTTILQHHLLRTDYFCTVILANQLTDVQRQLGTMRAGRLYGNHARNIATELPVQQAKINLKDLTVTMSGLMYEAIWFCGVSDWQCSCLKLLGEVLTEVEGLNRGIEARLMRARIQYLISSAESIKRHNNAMRENGQADMNVLYSIISQVDNRLNAKMAAASSRDSAAMKTLAFLTTLFLPGTSIATIFSTGMFNWQGSANGSGDGKVVSKWFWVYWAFTVPLTIVVAVGWRLWWSWEKKNFDEDVIAEIKAINGDGEATGGPSEALQGGYETHDSTIRPLRIHLGARSRTTNYLRSMKNAVKRRVGVKKVEASSV